MTTTETTFPAHGQRVEHRVGSTGTAVGDHWDDDGEPTVTVVWDDSPLTTEPTAIAHLSTTDKPVQRDWR